MSARNFFKLLISIAVSELAGVVGSFFTVSAIPAWYAGLVKPALNPPAWVFGPVWITLYALMGIAAFLVWSRVDSGSEARTTKDSGWARAALGIFGTQLFLNAAWSIIFFGLHSPGWALADIAALWLAIVLTIAAFAKIFRPAAWLLAPYLLWVTFAAYLNYAIWILN